MIIVLTILFMVLTGVSMYMIERCQSGLENAFITTTIFSGVVTTVGIIVTGILTVCVAGSVTIEQRIALYEEENAVIESQIATVVEKYMDYEQTTFKDCSAKSMITLVDLYPELKADTLVSKQIEVYLENNNKIKELKESLINRPVCRWWLYFGR